MKYLYELFLAWRYFHSKKKHPFARLISVVAVGGIAVGVASLIIVISVMSGFEKNLVDRVVGTYAHLIVESDGWMADAAGVTARLKKSSLVADRMSAYVTGQALLRNGSFAQGILVRGVKWEDERRVTRLGEYGIEGRFPAAGENGIYLGEVLARSLGVWMDSELEFFAPDRKESLKLKVSGIFRSGMYDYDANLAYLELSDAQKIFKAGAGISGLALQAGTPEEALRHKAEIQRLLGYDYYVRSWRDMNAPLFGAIQLEKTVMFLILSLMVLVGCANIVACLTIMVIEKIRDIGILRSVGAGQIQIMRIFAWIGFWIGFWGTALGFVSGILIAAFIGRYPIIKIPSEIYYLDQLPVDLRMGDAACIALSALGLSLLSACYPAWMASRVPCVQAIRYE